MSAATLHAVTKACQKPAAGLKALAIIEPTDLAAQPVWYLEPSIDSLSFLPDKAAYAFEADRLTARLTEKTPTNDRHGDKFEYLLQAFVSGMRPDIELYRAKIRNRRYHVVATYQNDLQRFLPFMRLSADGDSGDRSSKNGYSFSGTMRMHRPAPYLDATFDVIGGPYVPPGGGSSGDATLVTITTIEEDYTYSVPSGKWVAGIEVRSSDAQTLSMGTSPGGEDISGMAVPLDALQAYVLNGGMFDTFGSQTIYFSGLEGTNTIKIWLLG